MRAGWRQKRLADVCTLQRGFDLPTKDRNPGTNPLVSSSGVVDYIDQAKVRGPGVVTGRSGSIGKVFFVENDFWPLNTALYVKEFFGNDERFVYLLLQSLDLVRFASGTGVPTLNRNHVSDELVCIPDSIVEQRKIVAVLDEAFAAIASATANAGKNLANARALFEASVRDTFANPEPSWELLTLKEAARDFGRGKSKHRPRNDLKLYGGDYPFIQTGDVRNSDHLIIDHSQTYSDAGLAQSKLWPKGTICITIAANIAETGILNFDACFPDSVIGMVVDPARTSNSYVEYLLQSLRAVFQAKSKGSAQANINLATFENERFPFPPKDVQMAIVARLSKLSKQVRVMEALYRDKLIAFDALKQSLLHRAFTGELPATMRDTIAA